MALPSENNNITAAYEELRKAVLKNQLETIKQVFTKNDDEASKELLEIQDEEHGETILLQACRSRELTFPTLALLFSQIRRIGQDDELLRQHFSRRSNNGSTAFMLITQYSPHHETIEKFLESIVLRFGENFLKEQLDSRTTHGDTPLALACSNKNITTETVLLLSSWLAEFGLSDQHYKDVRHLGIKQIRRTKEEIDNVYRLNQHQSELIASINAECEALRKAAEANNAAEIKNVFQRSVSPRKLVDDSVSCYEQSRSILMQALAQGASEDTITTLVGEIVKVGTDESLKIHLLHKDAHKWTSLKYAVHFSTSLNVFKLFTEKIEQVGGKASLHNVLAATDKDEFLLPFIRKAIRENDHSAIRKLCSDREIAIQLLEKRHRGCTVLEQALADQPGIKMGDVKLPPVSLDTFDVLFDEFERIGRPEFAVSQLEGRRNRCLLHLAFISDRTENAMIYFIISKILTYGDRKFLKKHVSQVELETAHANNHVSRAATFQLLRSLKCYFGLFDAEFSLMRRVDMFKTAEIIIPDALAQLRSANRKIFEVNVEEYIKIRTELVNAALDQGERDIKAVVEEDLSKMKAKMVRIDHEKKRMRREKK